MPAPKTTSDHPADSVPRITHSRDGRILRVHLTAPAQGNTIDLDFTAGLAEAVADLDGIGCVLLTAAGPNFCLGGDVAQFAGAEDPGAYIDELAADLHRSLVRLDTAGVPVVVAAQGWSAGAGLRLVLAGDVVVLEDGSRLRPAYSAIGLSPDGGMSWTLPRAVGRARAMDMLLTNRVMDAAEALTAGLASRVVSDGTAVQVAEDIARQIAAGPARALAAARTLVRDGRDRDLAAHLDAERASISTQAGGPEGREGVAAFLGRRAPTFP
jgi:2-(1,2-epoxy-1,2-dihydrophenyl)acetyl-CoA isomerase